LRRLCLAEKLPFPSKEKIGARKIKKCKGNFSARLRATRGRRGRGVATRSNLKMTRFFVEAVVENRKKSYTKNT